MAPPDHAVVSPPLHAPEKYKLFQDDAIRPEGINNMTTACNGPAPPSSQPANADAAEAGQRAVLRALATSGACPRFTALLRAAGVASPADAPYEELLRVLRTAPLTTYGAYEAECAQLLGAMRAGDGNAAERLAAGLCGEVPLWWGTTSGTTGAGKLFPAPRAFAMRALSGFAQAVPVATMAKFPPGGSGGGNGTPTDASAPAAHCILSLALSGLVEELPPIKGGSGWRPMVGSISSVVYNMSDRAPVPAASSGASNSAAQVPPAPRGLLWHTRSCAAAGRYYLLWLCAAASPGFHNITMLSDLFAGNLLAAVAVLEARWRELAEDLRARRVVPGRLPDDVPGKALRLVDAWLAGNDAAAAEVAAAHIERVMAAHEQGKQEPLLSALMPHLRAVLVIATGSHTKYVPALLALLGEDTVVFTAAYGGTESYYGLNTALLDANAPVSRDPTRASFALMPDKSAFFEFLPLGEDGQAEPLTMDELVTPGRRYELVVTTFGGLLRYRIGDVVAFERHTTYDAARVAGPPSLLVDSGAANSFADALLLVTGASKDATVAAATPAAAAGPMRTAVVGFVGRAGEVLNLVGEKYEEAPLLAAVSIACAQLAASSSPGGAAPFPGLAEFCAREVIGDEAGKHYRFYWELAAPAAAAGGGQPPPSAADIARWEQALDAQLGAHNSHYPYARKTGLLAAVRIAVVARGTFAALKAAAVAAKKIAPSQFKQPLAVASGSDAAAALEAAVVAVGSGS